jgi:GT2 family glycosyltransferase
LFLNSDTTVEKDTLAEVVHYMDKHRDIGALSCKVLLPDGTLDKDTRRSFITPWIGLTHIFLKLDKIFPRSETFGKYWYGYIPDDTEHEVDVFTGSFFLYKKKCSG